MNKINPSGRTAAGITSPDYLLVLAFIEGAVVMAVELLSGKMFAPYYGNSLYIWTTVIGITLAGLATGYFTGGYFSARYTRKPLLFYFFLVSASVVVIMPGWANKIMMLCMGLGYEKGAVISCILFLFPAMACCGMIPPALIETAAGRAEQSGKTTGRIYAVSTCGGIVSVLLTGFFIVPAAGLRLPVYIAGLLLALPPLLFFMRKNFIVFILSVLFFSIIIPSGLKRPNQRHGSPVKVLHRSDGLMGQILVVDDLTSAKRTLMVNNISQSFLHVPTGRSQWKYIHRLAMYCSNKPAQSKVLVCGLGGGNLINELNNLQFNIDAVEIDPRMEMVARQFFGMVSNVAVRTDDARHYIRTCKDAYDIIILDMSAGENQPSNVYTVKCFNEIRQILKKDGWLFIHYQNILHGPGQMAIKSIGRTLRQSGFVTRLIDTQPNPELTSEFFFLATSDTVDFTKYSYERRDRFADPFNFPKYEHVFNDTFSFNDGYILSDDAPLMDILHAPALEGTRGATVQQLLPIFIREKIDVF